MQTNTGTGSNRQFVGALGYDTLTTNRVYVRARWYRPDLGRWQTEDPIGFEGGDWNLHPYVGDSPATQSDPSGLFNQACFSTCLEEAMKGPGMVKRLCQLAQVICMSTGPTNPACLVAAKCKTAQLIARGLAVAFCLDVCGRQPPVTSPRSCCAPSGRAVCANHCPTLRSCLSCCTLLPYGMSQEFCYEACCKTPWAKEPDKRLIELCDTLGSPVP